MYVKFRENAAGPDVPATIAGGVVEVEDARGEQLIKAGAAERAEQPERGPAPPPLSNDEVKRLRGLVGGQA